MAYGSPLQARTTVGVVLPDGTPLELDLAGPDTDAPAQFKAR